MKDRSTSRQVIEPKVISRIFGHGRGWAFTPKDFADLGDPRSVSVALTRLTRKGMIRKLARGLYDYPVEHPVMGRIAHSVDAVAKALARRDAMLIQPSGAYAANLAGLSDQVPMKVEFLTDGRYRRVKVGNQEIIFKHTTARNMVTAGRKSGTFIQALRHLGQRHVDDRVLSVLDRQVSEADRLQLLKDLPYAAAWIAGILRKLAMHRRQT